MTSTVKKSNTAALTLAAVGVVYGDIGTSPLYAMKEVFAEAHGLPLTPENILGVVSLIVWGLIIVVSLKYVVLVLRADNRGEGGIMALLSLALSSVGRRSRLYFPLMVMGLFGATLFYGDSVITPAISVLSAVEGLSVATPAFDPYVMPLAVIVLGLLFSFQNRGTAGIGKLFGVVMVIWFASLAAMGLVNIFETPAVLWALNPVHALHFLEGSPLLAFIALGAIVLAFTGSEALYADMGHFGKRPIRLAWFAVAFPALGLNYMGQGALLLARPETVSNPFYQQLGDWSIYPLVGLATLATIIASQATISGAFSMTKQAIALGFLPRMKIEYTSASEMGQIYVPAVNWFLMIVVMFAVIGFGSSSNLAAAYGIAVTATMTVTTVLTFFVIRYRWKYNLLLCMLATGFFMLIDVSLLSANMLKILHGGWFPLLLAIILFTMMLTWKRGRELVVENLQKHAIPLDDFLTSLFVDPPTRVPGTAIFMRSESDGVPHAMLHNLLHNKILHERVVFLTVSMAEVPYVPTEEQVRIHNLGNDCYQMDVQYGFKDTPDIPWTMELARFQGLSFDMMETSFFIARQTVVPNPDRGMALWREHLFVTMSRHARDAADYYRIPSNRVIELGTKIEI